MVKIEIDTEAKSVINMDAKVNFVECKVLLEAINQLQKALQDHLFKQVFVRDVELLRHVSSYYDSDDESKSLEEIYKEFVVKSEGLQDEVNE